MINMLGALSSLQQFELEYLNLMLTEYASVRKSLADASDALSTAHANESMSNMIDAENIHVAANHDHEVVARSLDLYLRFLSYDFSKRVEQVKAYREKRYHKVIVSWLWNDASGVQLDPAVRMVQKPTREQFEEAVKALGLTNSVQFHELAPIALRFNKVIHKPSILNYLSDEGFAEFVKNYKVCPAE